MSHVFVGARCLISVKFKFNLLLNVVVAKVSCADRGFIPIDDATVASPFHLRFVDGLVLTGCALFISNKEV